MATHSSVLAWRIPGTAEPGGLPSMRSHRDGHDSSDLAAAPAVALSRLPEMLSNSEIQEQKNNEMCILSLTQVYVVLRDIFILISICH